MLKGFIWLLLCGGYSSFIRTAARMRSAGAVLSFLDGFYLALLCFAILPCAMRTAHFYPAAALSILGVGVSFLLEKSERLHALLRPLLFAMLTALYFFHTAAPSPPFALTLALLGGMGLYHACAGILPEDVPPWERMGEALLAGLGFFLGTACFAGLL